MGEGSLWLLTPREGWMLPLGPSSAVWSSGGARRGLWLLHLATESLLQVPRPWGWGTLS